jgi:hypothetical protein
LVALLLLLLIGQAFGSERMSCKVQPVRGDGREWHYRTKIPGYAGDVRDDKCWYPGERMKPRGELYWDIDTTGSSAPPGDAIEPKEGTVLEGDPVEEGDPVKTKDATVLEPQPDGNFAERWRALDYR